MVHDVFQTVNMLCLQVFLSRETCIFPKLKNMIIQNVSAQVSTCIKHKKPGRFSSDSSRKTLESLQNDT